MGKPHKHAAMIHAWADGADIQVRTGENKWKDTKLPAWYDDFHYRIKPEPKPDVVFELIMRQVDAYPEINYPEHWEQPNIRFTFDGETGKLKKAEVIE